MIYRVTQTDHWNVEAMTAVLDFHITLDANDAEGLREQIEQALNLYISQRGYGE